MLFPAVRCKYSGEYKAVVLNMWVFEDDPDVVCRRSSGPSDYRAEWVAESLCKGYMLRIRSYERDEPWTVLAHADNVGQILLYCAENLHPLETDQRT